MTENEYDVLDELYFVTHYDDLERALPFDKTELKQVLKSLWKKGWLRCYDGIDMELESSEADMENQFDKYHYLASKEGLMAHNTR